MIPLDDIIRIELELQLGKPPAHPDSPEEAQMRIQLAKEREEILAQGFAVDTRFEAPSPNDE